MGIVDRIGVVLGAKAEKVMDKLETPEDQINMAYKRLLELEKGAQESLVTILASEKELDSQLKVLEVRKSDQETKVKKFLGDGNAEMARTYAANVLVIEGRIKGLVDTQEKVKEQEQVVRKAVEKLRAKVENMKVQKENMKVQSQTAMTMSKISNSLTGMGGDTDVGAMLARAQERIDSMNARTDAVTQLKTEGVLEDKTGEDAPEASSADIDAVLARLQ